MKSAITLGIETSCDETALALLETQTDQSGAVSYRILAQTIFSQVDIHAVYGGVFPIIAKREHARRLVPLLEHILHEAAAKDTSFAATPLDASPEALASRTEIVTAMLSEKESELLTALLASSLMHQKPAIDQISVTHGPGLEPALWVGVNFARALSIIWNIPVIASNHMEGHIVGSMLPHGVTNAAAASAFTPLIQPEFPAIALLISGGHTELVEVANIGTYKIIGATLDDAVGEAFDKVARMMNLPYPGGPLISKLAEKARVRFAALGANDASLGKNPIVLPRPMLHSPYINFSFSGLKTSVLYLIEKLKKESAAGNIAPQAGEIPPQLSSDLVENIALAFEDAATDVLVAKTHKAFDAHPARTLIVGGGVIANKHIREALAKLALERGITLLLPPEGVSGDNALMIALAGALSQASDSPQRKKATPGAAFSAEGNISF
ncbi:MAG: tRNA N6-adenosine threonylcarbamoyltransferase [Candidatus Taylorbacteria bacterium]|nr:tRNA N6-adenosine threonylcarbamoyltransferase [Candidatus Taylorbacteria bacterium]